MFTVKRSPNNPLLSPDTNEPWEEKAVFNWCPIQDGKTTHYVYRAMSSTENYFGAHISISSVGYAKSKDGVDFDDRRQFVFPEYAWERYGCEDPRVAKIDDTYYIFYTALSQYPFNADGIKIAVATTKNFKTIDEKHLVTPFNAKAMVIFPERVNGKIVAMLSVDTDRPGKEKICIARFERVEQIWDEDFWRRWYSEVDTHIIDPRRSKMDHIEVGAPPVKTKDGWLLVYGYIENYFRENNPFPVDFGVEALLLDLEDPKMIKGKTSGPMFSATEIYEKSGQVSDIVFPTGALLLNNTLEIFYGGADTVCCKATVNLDDLLFSMQPHALDGYVTRYEKNPILVPRAGFDWEKNGVFNPAAIQIGSITYILYRAMSKDNTSTIGYARSGDGYTIAERSNEPIYVPRESFEIKARGGNSGCEDPRLTLLDETIYMCYTAYDSVNPWRVALTSISLLDFQNKNWNWAKPTLISPIGADDKDAFVFPEKINGKYLIFHRIDRDICADYVDSLDFSSGPMTKGTPIMLPRRGTWDGDRIGNTGLPIKTKHGWVMLYHGVSSNHHTYRVGLALLDLKDPRIVLARTSQPIFAPDTSYERVGVVPNVVFPCGIIERDDTIFLYYGGADDVVCIATVSIKKLLDSLL